VATGDQGLCLEGCKLGQPALTGLNDPLSPKKCHGREDSACTPYALFNLSVCLPVCGRDDECPAGRKCDLFDGTCTQEPKMGLAVGQPCNVDPNNDACAGICLPNLGATVGVCSSLCVLGGVDFTYECGGLSHGLCFYTVNQMTDAGMGDLGGCTNACAHNADCAGQGSTYCFAFGPPGHAYCLTPDPCVQTSDCVNPTTTCIAGSCVDLSYGPV
jgi:hypothetical protein